MQVMVKDLPQNKCAIRCDYCGRCVDHDYKFYLVEMFNPDGDEYDLYFVVCEKCYEEVKKKIEEVFKK